MCGRYVSVSSPTILAERFHVEEIRTGATDPNYPEPSYNVTPRAEVPVVAESKGHRVLDVVRWGLVPSWAKSLAVGDKMINARAESVLTSNAYKRPFARHRCIVPADGFYEWQTIEGQKVRQPWFVKRRDGEPLAFAGLWSIWHDKKLGDDAPRIRSCTIITTDPNELMRSIHNRMPVILPESEWDRWLDPENNDVDSLTKLLVPLPGDELEAWPVATLVNKPVNNGPELIEAAPVMQYSTFVDAIRRDGAAFVEAARSAGVERQVPSCPEWTVADLCSHVGRLHRWATEIVEARPANPTRRWADSQAPEGAALVDFVADGYGPLADTLARARPDEPCWTWIDQQSVMFWARRQANELALHRWDAQCAAGATAPIEHEHAVDSIQELFDILPFRPGGPPTGNGESIHLHCTDGAEGHSGEWLIRLNADGPSVVNEHAKADVAARGKASDLLLMMWGRIPVDAIEVFGDAALLGRWSDGRL